MGTPPRSGPRLRGDDGLPGQQPRLAWTRTRACAGAAGIQGQREVDALAPAGYDPRFLYVISIIFISFPSGPGPCISNTSVLASVQRLVMRTVLGCPDIASL